MHVCMYVSIATTLYTAMIWDLMYHINKWHRYNIYPFCTYFKGSKIPENELYATVGEPSPDAKHEVKIEHCAAYGTICKWLLPLLSQNLDLNISVRVLCLFLKLQK